jgi:hypothetical protein
MATHIITIEDIGRGKVRMYHQGHDIGTSHEPLFAASRYLIANQLAQPRDTIETHRGDTCALRATVWVAARLTVVERSLGVFTFTIHADSASLLHYSPQRSRNATVSTHTS